MRRKFYTLDVFTSTALAGNPLAVVMDAEGLDTADMQKIAREFNLSETVFILPPHNPLNTARIRIFTPARELPFAGHPTIGTAIILAETIAPDMLGAQDISVVLEEEIGTIASTVRHVKGQAAHARFALPRLPERIDIPMTRERLAAALGLEPEDIGFDSHMPSVFSAGVAYAFVPLASLEAVAKAEAVLDVWDEAFGTLDRPCAYVYCRQTSLRASSFHTRMFGHRFGIVEDPATGSAAAAFAGVIMAFDQPAPGDHHFAIEQGFEMGRPSLISLGLDVGQNGLVSASIGGHAVIIMQGTLNL